MKIREITIRESATPGGTSAANIGTVVNPKTTLGSAIGKKSYTGSPGKSGTKAPPQPKVKAVDPNKTTGVSLFGGPAIKR